MPQSVLDLGLQPTKRAKAQAFRRQKDSEDQTKFQTANQIESAQQLQCFLPPPSCPCTKPLGLQEIGHIFDQETQRLWDIDLRQRGLVDGVKTRDKLSQLHHELFRVNQCKILDQYWRKTGQTNSQRDNAREIARRDLRKKIYKRCKTWFESEDSTIYLNSDTELGSAQLQLRGPSGMPLNTGCFSDDERVSQWQSGRASVMPLDIPDFNNNEEVSWAQSQLVRTSGSLPDTVDSGYYGNFSSALLQPRGTSLTPLDTRCLNSNEGVSCAQLQLGVNVERLLDPFPYPTQINNGQEQDQFTYVGQDTPFGSYCYE